MDVPFFGVVDRSNAGMIALMVMLLVILDFVVPCLLLCIPWFLFIFVIYKGVMGRFNIRNEDDITVFCEVCCCMCCTVLKMGRHVDGYHRALVGAAVAVHA